MFRFSFFTWKWTDVYFFLKPSMSRCVNESMRRCIEGPALKGRKYNNPGLDPGIKRNPDTLNTPEG